MKIPLSSPSSCSSDLSTPLVPPPCSNPRRKFDVFLSSRGEDTRKNFMGHLKAALSENGIETFVDDDRLERGKSISPQLLEAIEDSRCAIVILSPNYASSSWCLDELVKILVCMRTLGLTVLPIFYHVDPLDVRKQTNTFERAFAKHQLNFGDDIERVTIWKEALTEVANLAGLDSQNYRDEAQLIIDIVAEVSSKVSISVVLSNNTESEDPDLYKKNPILSVIVYPCISGALVLVRLFVIVTLIMLVTFFFVQNILYPFLLYILPEM